MNFISVIIIAKNEAARIAAAIRSARLVSDDVIVVDSGSVDGTKEIVIASGARLKEINWEGYGNARNQGAEAARHQQVICIDADELISEGLARSIRNLQPEADCIYGFKRVNFLGGKRIRHGEWGHDHVFRLYNRQMTRWDNAGVHEQVLATGMKRVRIDGELLHYTTDSLDSYQLKLDRYAALSAEWFYKQGRKAGFVKIFFSPLFGLIKNYIVRKGFLDGVPGLKLALMHARYTQKKYRGLKKLHQASIPKNS